MTAPVLWAVILGGAAVTYGIRALPVLLGERFQPSERGRAFLSYFAPTVIVSIVVPELVAPGGTLLPPLQNPYLAAGAAAFLAGRYTKNSLIGMAVGIGVLYLLGG
ncbi:MAG TPA: AzlD domain-containing protein [Candidatus Acidoferrum sp.]|nr:AzlD domain-containing protein [Candidatus Acidoferrum sp.]